MDTQSLTKIISDPSLIKTFIFVDFIYSPLLWHPVLLLVSTIKAAVLKLCSRYNESIGWDIAVAALLFINPFAAFFASSFWGVWLQSVILGLPLYFAGYYFRDSILKISDYRDSAAAVMLGSFLFVAGHLLSGVFLLVQYIWVSMQ